LLTALLKQVRTEGFPLRLVRNFFYSGCCCFWKALQGLCVSFLQGLDRNRRDRALLF